MLLPSSRGAVRTTQTKRFSCLLVHLIHTSFCPPYISETEQQWLLTIRHIGLRTSSMARYCLSGTYTISFSGPMAWNALRDQFHAVESTDFSNNSEKHVHLITRVITDFCL